MLSICFPTLNYIFDPINYATLYFNDCFHHVKMHYLNSIIQLEFDYLSYYQRY
jgi:hypothetical protein